MEETRSNSFRLSNVLTWKKKKENENFLIFVYCTLPRACPRLSVSSSRPVQPKTCLSFLLFWIIMELLASSSASSSLRLWVHRQTWDAEKFFILLFKQNKTKKPTWSRFNCAAPFLSTDTLILMSLKVDVKNSKWKGENGEGDNRSSDDLGTVWLIKISSSSNNAIDVLLMAFNIFLFSSYIFCAC